MSEPNDQSKDGAHRAPRPPAVDHPSWEEPLWVDEKPPDWANHLTRLVTAAPAKVPLHAADNSSQKEPPSWEQEVSADSTRKVIMSAQTLIHAIENNTARLNILDDSGARAPRSITRAVDAIKSIERSIPAIFNYLPPEGKQQFLYFLTDMDMACLKKEQQDIFIKHIVSMVEAPPPGTEEDRQDRVKSTLSAIAEAPDRITAVVAYRDAVMNGLERVEEPEAFVALKEKELAARKKHGKDQQGENQQQAGWIGKAFDPNRPKQQMGGFARGGENQPGQQS